MRSWLAAGLLVLAVAAFSPARTSAAVHWAASWGAAPSDVDRTIDYGRRTARVIVAPHRGGAVFRVGFSNRLGDAPLRIGPATIGRSAGGAEIKPGSLRRLRFDGRRSLKIPTGEQRFSDPVRLRAAAFERLAVSTYLPGRHPAVTRHAIAVDHAYVTQPGGRSYADRRSGRAFRHVIGSWVAVDALQVRRRSCRQGTIVAFGDSITDGFGATIGADRRWPDQLQRRLIRRHLPLTVLNAGISGNLVTRKADLFGGASGLERLRPDALSQPRLRAVLILQGINDLAAGVPAAKVIAGLRRMTARVSRAGALPILGTLTPTSRTYGDEAARLKVNEWIARQRRARVVDFARALADPVDPASGLARHMSDPVHPDDSGYRRMAGEVPMSLLERLTRCRERRR